MPCRAAWQPPQRASDLKVSAGRPPPHHSHAWLRRCSGRAAGHADAGGERGVAQHVHGLVIVACGGQPQAHMCARGRPQLETVQASIQVLLSFVCVCVCVVCLCIL